MEILDNVSKDREFVFWDSSTARNVRELCQKIKIMSPYVFGMYVNEKKNEFASWIEKEYCKNELAAEVLKCRQKGDALDCLRNAVGDAEIRKEAMLDSIIKRPEKEQERLLQVVSRPRNEKIFLIPDKPFFNVFGRRAKHLKEERRVLVPIKAAKKQGGEKRALIDDVVEGEAAEIFENMASVNSRDALTEDEKSNVFKEGNTALNEDKGIKPNSIERLNMCDIISRIKEVHR